MENNPLRYVDRTGHHKEDSGVASDGGVGPVSASDGGAAVSGEVMSSVDSAVKGPTIEELDTEVAKIYERLAQEEAEEASLAAGDNIAAREGAGKTGTVWDSIKATQPAYEGTSLPKSFNIKVGDEDFWVNPNGTKHMNEYLTSEGKNIGTMTSSVSSQGMLTEFQGAFNQAIKNNGVVLDKMIRGGDCEFMLSAPRESGMNVVVKHARYNPR